MSCGVDRGTFCQMKYVLPVEITFASWGDFCQMRWFCHLCNWLICPSLNGFRDFIISVFGWSVPNDWSYCILFFEFYCAKRSTDLSAWSCMPFTLIFAEGTFCKLRYLFPDEVLFARWGTFCELRCFLPAEVLFASWGNFCQLWCLLPAGSRLHISSICNHGAAD